MTNYRKPVAAVNATDAAERVGLAVICDDGSVFVEARGRGWQEVLPIPGTQAAAVAQAAGARPLSTVPPEGAVRNMLTDLNPPGWEDREDEVAAQTPADRALAEAAARVSQPTIDAIEEARRKVAAYDVLRLGLADAAKTLDAMDGPVARAAATLAHRALEEGTGPARPTDLPNPGGPYDQT